MGKKYNPCEECEHHGPGCEGNCGKLAFYDKNHPKHEFAVWTNEENKKMRFKYPDADITIYEDLSGEEKKVEEQEVAKVEKAEDKKDKAYLVWVKKDEVTFVKAQDEKAAFYKAKEDYPDTTEKVERIEWGDKYRYFSDISDTVLAKNNIQPRCRKCDCLLPMEGFKTKHGRGYCDKCLKELEK